ncbi:hypothetical protein RF11_14744 [Thelohanellus kitauei]|uniref:Sortilin N-terminal domain-containing protein n=1 Tax=Thelohanellus kitauei TaxID=669202 RepID=A0A0C2MX84_THEKT|nr:hypothetical protein RF11_14744 [Thelohanellus kitauei]
MIIGIIHNETNKEITTKIIHLNHLNMTLDISIYENVNEFFYLHGNLYILAWKKRSTLCLFTFNEYDRLIELVCHLSKNNKDDRKCSFVISPHVSGVIFANLKNDDNQTRTHISFDNGKNFSPIKLDGDGLHNSGNHCSVEFNLDNLYDSITKYFPETLIVKIQGAYHMKGSTSHHIFVSLNGGENWKMLDSRIEKLVILNKGRLMCGTERETGRIIYSFDEGMNWYFADISANNFQSLIPLESPSNLVITGINYDEYEEIIHLIRFDFSNVTRILNLMSGSMCERNDFGISSEQKTIDNDCQEQEIAYLVKNPSSVSFNNRTLVPPSIKPCLNEDCDWYFIIHTSERIHCLKNKSSIFDRISNINESIENGGDHALPIIDSKTYT